MNIVEIDSKYEQAVREGDEKLSTSLAEHMAACKGFSTFAWHGTFSDFDEFKKRDIGFHFASCVYVAQNRVDDKLSEIGQDQPCKVLHVALHIQNPLTLASDLDSWCARDIVAKANLHLTGEPFAPPTTMYMIEQHMVAKDAWKLLKSIGFTKDEVLKMHNDIANAQEIEFNTLYTENIHKRCIQSPYDAIVYKNDFEAQEGFDPTCYIVFSPNQVKTLEPVYGAEDAKLVELSSRFDINSPKMSH